MIEVSATLTLRVVDGDRTEVTTFKPEVSIPSALAVDILAEATDRLRGQQVFDFGEAAPSAVTSLDLEPEPA